jgi:Domain of unknown function (DUF4389)
MMLSLRCHLSKQLAVGPADERGAKHMTDIPAWPASGWSDGEADRPAPILVAFGGSFPQRRLTVLFRIILIIPQYFVLYALSVAAEVIAVIGWFAALFIGRLPEFAADFLGGYLGWQTRVIAYWLLLTDTYPPFTLGDADYPVRVAQQPGRLNRLAVLFRIFLAIPAGIVAALLYYGACTIVLFIIWLIVLITGRMPDELYQAFAAVLRYLTRLNGYMLLLTSAYPAGLFGDRPGPGQPWSQGGAGGFAGGPGGFAGDPGGFADPARGLAGPAGELAGPAGFAGAPGGFGSGAADVTGAPGDFTGSPGQFTGTAGEFAGGAGWPPVPGGPAGPGGGFAAPGGPAGPGGWLPYPGTASRVPAPAVTPSWQLVLSDGAKRLVAVFLGLGVLVAAAYIASVVAIFMNSVNNAAADNNAANQVQAAIVPLNQALSSFDSDTSRCRATAQSFSCAKAADRKLAATFDTIAARLRGISMPSGAAAAAAGQLENAVTGAGFIFHRLGAANTVAQYQLIVGSVNINQAISQIDQDYQNLGTTLNVPTAG